MKRRGSLYRGGESRKWLKTKCSETGMFAITGFSELGEASSMPSMSPKRGRRFMPRRTGAVFRWKGLWHLLDQRRAGPATKGMVPVSLGLVADIKFFGRHKGGFDPRRCAAVQIAKPQRWVVVDRIAAFVLAGSAVVMVIAVVMLIGLLLVAMLRG